MTTKTSESALHKRAEASMVAATLLCGALLLAIEPTGDPDLFWHLKTGALALATRSLLPIDPFSFSFGGAPWAYKDLLADVLLYLGFAAFGFVWFALLKALCATGIALACHLAARPDQRLEVVSIGVAGLLLSSFWLVERPNLFSMALFPLMLVLIDRARRRFVALAPRALYGACAPLLAVEWLWIWLHRAAIVGLVLLFGLAGLLLLARRERGPRWRALFGPRPSERAVLMAGATAIAAMALACVNPSGTAIFETSLTVASSSMLRRYISEWQQIGVAQFLRDFPCAALLVATASVGGALSLAAALRRRDDHSTVDAWHLALLLVFVALMCKSVRWIPYASTVAALMVARIAAGQLSPVRHRMGRKTMAGVACLMLALLCWHRRNVPFTLGEARERVPAAAIAFAKVHALAGRVVHPLQFGGYLIWTLWPEAQVLVDGRNDTVYPADFIVQTIEAQSDPARFYAMRRFDQATWVLADNSPATLSHRFLAHDPRWALVYWSDAATIYVLRAAHPALVPLQFRFIDPAAVDRSVAGVLLGSPTEAQRAMLQTELGRMVDASPDSIRANSALCIYHHLRGPPGWPERDRVLSHLRVIAPRHPAVVELARRFGLSP